MISYPESNPDYHWYYEMSLLETMEFMFSDWITMNYSDHGIAIGSQYFYVEGGDLWIPKDEEHPIIAWHGTAGKNG